MKKSPSKKRRPLGRKSAQQRTLCRCESGIFFDACCEPILAGARAVTPEALMRSRYVAYALGRANYIINTTDPDGPHYETDREAWLETLHAYMAKTNFKRLKVMHASTPHKLATTGTVRFRAQLQQGADNLVLIEKSEFRLVDGQWLYHDGDARWVEETREEMAKFDILNQEDTP